MVQVKLTKCSYGYTKITADGHADDPTVCAAVSSIMWGLSGTLLNLKEKPQINAMVMQSGSFDIDVTPFVGSAQTVVDTCYLFAEVGLRQIAARHPGQVIVEL